jgi:O-antigen/teichoic acid export membrane protein
VNKLSNIAKNISYVATGIVFIKIIGFLYVIYVIRSIAVEQYGIYSYAATIVGMLGLLVDFGFGQLLIKEYHNQTISKQEIFSTALVIKLVYALIIYAGVLAFSRFYSEDILASKILIIYSSTLFWGAIQRNLLTLLRAQEKFKHQNVLSVINELALLTGGIIVIKIGLGITGLIWSSVIISFILAIYSIMILAKRGYADIKNVNLATMYYLIKNSYPLCLVSIITLVFFRIDTVLLKTISGNYTVGLYSAVYTLAAAFLIIPSIFFSVMFPVFSRLAVGNQSSFGKSLDKSLKYLTLLSMPIAVGGLLLSNKIIFIAYGSKYTNAGLILSVLFPFLVLSFVNSLMQHAIITTGGQKYMIIGVAIAALFNITLNLFLIPRYGALGASLTTVLSELFLAIMFGYLFYKLKLRFAAFTGWLIKVIIATGIMGGVVYILRQYHILIPFSIGAIVYSIVLLTLRSFDEEDKTVFMSLIPQKWNEAFNPQAATCKRWSI